jgi:hypothetical protein
MTKLNLYKDYNKKIDEYNNRAGDFRLYKDNDIEIRVEKLGAELFNITPEYCNVRMQYITNYSINFTYRVKIGEEELIIIIQNTETNNIANVNWLDEENTETNKMLIRLRRKFGYDPIESPKNEEYQDFLEDWGDEYEFLNNIDAVNTLAHPDWLNELTDECRSKMFELFGYDFNDFYNESIYNNLKKKGYYTI